MFARIKAVFSAMFVLSLSLLVAACSSAPKTFNIRGEGDPSLNRDINGKSLSVVVSVYQLKDAREFSKLTFDTLASGRPESELLGSALLEKTDAVVVPGGLYVSSEKLLADTKFVGIVAFFRRPDSYYWRHLVDAETVRSQGLNFRVQDCYVALAGIKPITLPGQPLNARPECGTVNYSGVRQAVRPGAQQPATAGQGKKRGMTQSIPDINVNAPTPFGPASTRLGSGGFGAINMGEQAAPTSSSGFFPPSR